MVAGAPGRRSPLPLETHATVSLLVCPAWNWDAPSAHQTACAHPPREPSTGAVAMGQLEMAGSTTCGRFETPNKKGR